MSYGTLRSSENIHVAGHFSIWLEVIPALLGRKTPAILAAGTYLQSINHPHFRYHGGKGSWNPSALICLLYLCFDAHYRQICSQAELSIKECLYIVYVFVLLLHKINRSLEKYILSCFVSQWTDCLLLLYTPSDWKRLSNDLVQLSVKLYKLTENLFQSEGVLILLRFPQEHNINRVERISCPGLTDYITSGRVRANRLHNFWSFLAPKVLRCL
jgi:hypothetical protein